MGHVVGTCPSGACGAPMVTPCDGVGAQSPSVADMFRPAELPAGYAVFDGADSQLLAWLPVDMRLMSFVGAVFCALVCCARGRHRHAA